VTWLLAVVAKTFRRGADLGVVADVATFVACSTGDRRHICGGICVFCVSTSSAVSNMLEYRVCVNGEAGRISQSGDAWVVLTFDVGGLLQCTLGAALLGKDNVIVWCDCLHPRLKSPAAQRQRQWFTSGGGVRIPPRLSRAESCTYNSLFDLHNLFPSLPTFDGTSFQLALQE